MPKTFYSQSSLAIDNKDKTELEQKPYIVEKISYHSKNSSMMLIKQSIEFPDTGSNTIDQNEALDIKKVS